MHMVKSLANILDFSCPSFYQGKGQGGVVAGVRVAALSAEVLRRAREDLC